MKQYRKIERETKLFSFWVWLLGNIHPIEKQMSQDAELGESKSLEADQGITTPTQASDNKAAVMTLNRNELTQLRLINCGKKISRVTLGALSLAFPIHFGHITVCRSAALLALFAAIHFVMKFPHLVSPSYYAIPPRTELQHPVAYTDVKFSEVAQKTSRSLIPLPSDGTRAPHQLFENHALR